MIVLLCWYINHWNTVCFLTVLVENSMNKYRCFKKYFNVISAHVIRTDPTLILLSCEYCEYLALSIFNPEQAFKKGATSTLRKHIDNLCQISKKSSVYLILMLMKWLWLKDIMKSFITQKSDCMLQVWVIIFRCDNVFYFFKFEILVQSTRYLVVLLNYFWVWTIYLVVNSYISLGLYIYGCYMHEMSSKLAY